MGVSKLFYAIFLTALFSASPVKAEAMRAKGVVSDTQSAAQVPLTCPQGISDDNIDFEIDRFDVGSVSLVYQKGPKNGVPLVILPGMSVPAESYRESISRLCGKFEVYLLTQRGHYETGWASDSAYHVSDFGSDATRFIDEVVGEPVILSGHSLGALVALWVVSNHPEAVVGYVAEDGPFLVQEEKRWHDSWVKPLFVGLAARSRAYHSKGATLEEITEMFADERVIMPTVSRSFDRRIMALGKTLSSGVPPFPDAELAERDNAYASFLAGNAPTNRAFWPDALLSPIAASTLHLDPALPAAAVDASITEGFDHMEAFARISVPTLYWESDRDMVGVISAQDHRNIVETIARKVRVRHVYAVNSGHRIHRDQPNLFAGEIIRFFGPTNFSEAD